MVDHGGEQVGKHQAAFHKVELAVKFQGLGREQFPPQAGEGQVIGGKEPLVAHVVDRVHHRQALEAGAVVIEGPQIDGHQAGLPLVAWQTSNSSSRASIISTTARLKRR